MRKTLLLAVAAFSVFSVQGTERAYTFNFDEEKVDYYGTGRKENIDVAVCLNAPALAGFTVTGISVALPGNADSYESTSAFLTKELTIETVDGLRVNVPDICGVEARVSDGVLTATFAEPYTITAEPVYVGYSFAIKELTEENKAPLAVVGGTNPDGLWFHSNRTSLKWTNYVDREPGGLQSAMNILISGDFQACSASVELPDRAVYRTGEDGQYSFTVVNYGSERIAAVECDWTAGEESGTAVYEFPESLKSTLGARGTAVINLPAETAQGVYPVKVTATRVNGQENVNRLCEAESGIIFTDRVPVNLPLVEEYTGLWCGNCPRGYATLEWMKEKYGYDFVAASWHNSDPMEITTSFPGYVRGFPTAWIDRQKNLDPSAALVPQWESYRAMETDYAISCSTDFASDDRSSLTAKTEVLPIADGRDISIGYLLIADGLSNPSWLQSNYYSGDVSADLPGEWAQFFADAPKMVSGLVYNDVVVDDRYCLGAANSLPVDTEAFVDYTHEVTFSLDKITNLSGDIIEVNPEKVRVLAYILDAEGNVLNSCSSAYPGEGAPGAGVMEIGNGHEVSETLWFDLQGTRVATPAQGLFIAVDILSDGTRRARKVMVTR